MTYEFSTEYTVTENPIINLKFDLHRGDWACVQICDATGVFSVQSSYGNWSHRWNIEHTGHDRFLDFIKASTKNSVPYLLTKFEYEGKDLEDVLDEDATQSALKQEVLNRRRTQEITKQEARDMWWDVEHIFCYESADRFLHSIYEDSPTRWGAYEEPWEFIVYEESGSHAWLKHFLKNILGVYLNREEKSDG